MATKTPAAVWSVGAAKATCATMRVPATAPATRTTRGERASIVAETLMEERRDKSKRTSTRAVTRSVYAEKDVRDGGKGEYLQC
jgi:hypothetical protein